MEKSVICGVVIDRETGQVIREARAEAREAEFRKIVRRLMKIGADVEKAREKEKSC